MSNKFKFSFLRCCCIAQEHPDPQLAPPGQHIQDAAELHHEKRDDVEGILVLRIEEVQRPNVDVPEVAVLSQHVLIQPVEVSTHADVLLHLQHVRNDRNVLFRTQWL